MKEVIAKNYKTIVSLLVVVMLCGGYTLKVVHDAKEEAAKNNAANKSLQVNEGESGYVDMQGNQADVGQYVGQVLVVNSWASWSPDSATELPQLASIARSYENAEVTILAINRAESKDTAERFLKTVKADDGIKLVLDPTDRFYRSVSGYAMPETLVYNKQGEVVYHHHGPISDDELRSAIDKALLPLE